MQRRLARGVGVVALGVMAALTWQACTEARAWAPPEGPELTAIQPIQGDTSLVFILRWKQTAQPTPPSEDPIQGYRTALINISTGDTLDAGAVSAAGPFIDSLFAPLALAVAPDTLFVDGCVQSLGLEGRVSDWVCDGKYTSLTPAPPPAPDSVSVEPPSGWPQITSLMMEPTDLNLNWGFQTATVRAVMRDMFGRPAACSQGVLYEDGVNGPMTATLDGVCTGISLQLPDSVRSSLDGKLVTPMAVANAVEWWTRADSTLIDATGRFTYWHGKLNAHFTWTNVALLEDFVPPFWYAEVEDWDSE